MRRLRVFIASATSARPLAQALCAEMKIMGKRPSPGHAEEFLGPAWDVVPWWDRQKSHVQQLGRTIIEGLIEECKAADLAVTLLTRDDLTIKRGRKEREPRDNCIFEAGLFMGGLGLSAQRSILVTTVERSFLPSDLQGVQVIEIPHPRKDELKDPKWCRTTMKEVAVRLAQHVRSGLQDPPRRPSLPVLTPDDLMELEQPRMSGGDLEIGSGRAVVINTTQPAEVKIRLARQVRQNMDLGVDYVYFFRANVEHAAVVANLLRSLALGHKSIELPQIADHEPTDEEYNHVVRTVPDLIVESVRKAQQRLFIHFLPDDRAPVLFCVHNAGDYGKAKCYLRDVARNLFYLWADGAMAFTVASDLRRLQKNPQDPAIFYSAAYFNLYAAEGNEFRTHLEWRLRDVFGATLFDKLKPLCFVDTCDPAAFPGGSPDALLPGGASPQS